MHLLKAGYKFSGQTPTLLNSFALSQQIHPLKAGNKISDHTATFITFAKKRQLEISNRKAYHDYFFETSYIAGMVLSGTEIKSLRAGKASFNDSYCYFHKGELFVKSLHISEYSFGTYTNHEPMQERKLLLNKKELQKLEAKTKEKGYSIIPLKIFLAESGYFKMEIGLGKGKKNYDKRDTIKERETDRDIKRKYGV
jgi:SsrA-binding protein